MLALRMFQECASAMAAAQRAIEGSVSTKAAALRWLKHKLGGA